MNAIVVILDSLRKDHVRVYGNDRIKAPSLDALSEESLRVLPFGTQCGRETRDARLA